MNILHIIQDMNIGGAQRVLYNIAKRMKNDHHIVLTYQVCDEYKELLRQLLNTEVKVIMNMGEFVRAIQDYTYDIVHYHWWPGMKVMGTIFEKKKIPVVLSLQEQCVPPKINAFYVAGSRSNFEYLKDIPADRKKYIYFGIDTELFPENKKEVITEPVVLGRVSTIIPTKIPHNLIETLSKITLKDFRYYICGTGDQEVFERLETEISKYGLENRVSIINDSYVNDKYKMMDIFLYWLEDGEEEAFGLVFLEAMASKCIIVTKRVGSADEAIVDGETGFLFDHEDEINDILHKIVSDPSLQRKVKQNAWNVVHNRYTLEHFVNEYRVLYERLINEKK